jgi:hypothetical protein
MDPGGIVMNRKKPGGCTAPVPVPGRPQGFFKKAFYRIPWVFLACPSLFHSRSCRDNRQITP